MTVKISGKTVMLPACTVIEGECNVDDITFEIDKYYNEVDLSTMTAYANIERSDGTTDKITLDRFCIDDVVYATWTIDSSATAIPGELQVQISFVNEEGTVVFITEKFSLQVQSSIDAYTDLTQRDPNALYRLQQAMYNYVNRMQLILDDVNERLIALNGSGGSGSGGSGTGGSGTGGTTYGPSNQLPASYVSGLAAVATSGSYNDLLDKPENMDTSNFITYNEALAAMLEFQEMFSPVIITYLAVMDTSPSFNTIANENREKLINYYNNNNNFGRPMLLFDPSNNVYYPLMKITDGTPQLTFHFSRGTGYSVQINKNNFTYGFSE